MKSISTVATLSIASLSLLGSPARAAWEGAPQLSSPGSSVHFEFSRARPVSLGRAQIWRLTDFAGASPEAAGGQVKSRLTRVEYDCQDSALRVIARSEMSGHMGSGAPVFESERVDPWVLARPGSLAEAEVDLVCDRLGPKFDKKDTFKR